MIRRNSAQNIDFWLGRRRTLHRAPDSIPPSLIETSEFGMAATPQQEFSKKDEEPKANEPKSVEPTGEIKTLDSVESPFITGENKPFSYRQGAKAGSGIEEPINRIPGTTTVKRERTIDEIAPMVENRGDFLILYTEGKGVEAGVPRQQAIERLKDPSVRLATSQESFERNVRTGAVKGGAFTGLATDSPEYKTAETALKKAGANAPTSQDIANYYAGKQLTLANGKLYANPDEPLIEQLKAAGLTNPSKYDLDKARSIEGEVYVTPTGVLSKAEADNLRNSAVETALVKAGISNPTPAQIQLVQQNPNVRVYAGEIYDSKEAAERASAIASLRAVGINAPTEAEIDTVRNNPKTVVAANVGGRVTVFANKEQVPKTVAFSAAETPAQGNTQGSQETSISRSLPDELLDRMSAGVGLSEAKEQLKAEGFKEEDINKAETFLTFNERLDTIHGKEWVESASLSGLSEAQINLLRTQGVSAFNATQNYEVAASQSVNRVNAEKYQEELKKAEQQGALIYPGPFPAETLENGQQVGPDTAALITYPAPELKAPAGYEYVAVDIKPQPSPDTPTTPFKVVVGNTARFFDTQEAANAYISNLRVLEKTKVSSSTTSPRLNNLPPVDTELVKTKTIRSYDPFTQGWYETEVQDTSALLSQGRTSSLAETRQNFVEMGRGLGIGLKAAWNREILDTERLTPTEAFFASSVPNFSDSSQLNDPLNTIVLAVPAAGPELQALTVGLRQAFPGARIAVEGGIAKIYVSERGGGTTMSFLETGGNAARLVEPRTGLGVGSVVNPISHVERAGGQFLIDDIEVPVRRAVMELQPQTASSGFHTSFSPSFNGLEPSWAIVMDGRIDPQVAQIAKNSGLAVSERIIPAEQAKLFGLLPNKTTGQYIITDIYLPRVSEANAGQATKIFDDFANNLATAKAQGAKLDMSGNFGKAIPLTETDVKRLADMMGTTPVMKEYQGVTLGSFAAPPESIFTSPVRPGLTAAEQEALRIVRIKSFNPTVDTIPGSQISSVPKTPEFSGIPGTPYKFTPEQVKEISSRPSEYWLRLQREQLISEAESAALRSGVQPGTLSAEALAVLAVPQFTSTVEDLQRANFPAQFKGSGGQPIEIVRGIPTDGQQIGRIEPVISNPEIIRSEQTTGLITPQNPNVISGVPSGDAPIGIAYVSRVDNVSVPLTAPKPLITNPTIFPAIPRIKPQIVEPVPLKPGQPSPLITRPGQPAPRTPGEPSVVPILPVITPEFPAVEIGVPVPIARPEPVPVVTPAATPIEVPRTEVTPELQEQRSSDMDGAQKTAEDLETIEQNDVTAEPSPELSPEEYAFGKEETPTQPVPADDVDQSISDFADTFFAPLTGAKNDLARQTATAPANATQTPVRTEQALRTRTVPTTNMAPMVTPAPTIRPRTAPSVLPKTAPIAVTKLATATKIPVVSPPPETPARKTTTPKPPPPIPPRGTQNLKPIPIQRAEAGGKYHKVVGWKQGELNGKPVFYTFDVTTGKKTHSIQPIAGIPVVGNPHETFRVLSRSNQKPKYNSTQMGIQEVDVSKLVLDFDLIRSKAYKHKPEPKRSMNKPRSMPMRTFRRR